MRYFLLFAAAVLFASCKKHTAGKEVEIYLLKTFQSVPGKCQIDAVTSVLADTPFIHNSDVVTYTKNYHTFEFTSGSYMKMKAFTGNRAVAVTVDKQVIYYAFYVPAISSSTPCDQSIVMTDLVVGPNKIAVWLEGYPGTSSRIDDQRNNAGLLATLSAQNKLR